jgi:phospholipid transport system substrate-binding protein
MPAGQKREQVRALTLEALDFDALARLSMGRHWRDLNERQQRDFTEAFKQHLINTCCDMTSGFTDEHVTVLGEREEARGDRTVNASVGGTDDNGNKVEYVKVDFRTRQTNGQWRVIDVSTMGVSLLAAFKVQFESLMVVGGYDRVMKMLNEKNAAAAATGPATRGAATRGPATRGVGPRGAAK